MNEPTRRLRVIGGCGYMKGSVVQGVAGLPIAQVVALDQPVELLAGEGDHGPVQMPRPLKLPLL